VTPPRPTPPPGGRFRFLRPLAAPAGIRADAFAHLRPRRWQIDLFLFAAALALYLLTLSWSPFPGPPAGELLSRLRPDAAPAPSGLLWGWIARAIARTTVLPAASWMALVAAFCGALSVALMADLMMCVGYLVGQDPAPRSFESEAYGRRLSALCAGLFLMLCPPFWIASTRSLPHTFRTAMLMACAALFSRYQHWGRKRDLFALALLFGTGLSDSAVFLVFLPAFVPLMLRELVRWNKLASFPHHALLWGTLLASAGALLAANVLALCRRAASAGIPASPSGAFLGILRAHWNAVFSAGSHPGFLLLLAFAAVVWLVAFVLSHRSPWFYGRWEIAIRLACVLGALGILWNAPCSPWRLMGMSPFPVAPYLVIAASFGYMCGEFLVLGERNELREVRPSRKLLPRLSFAFALCLPFASASAACRNWGIADGRYAALAGNAAGEILSRRGEGRDIFFSSGVLDDTLRLLARERREPVRFATPPLFDSRAGRESLARSIADPGLSPALLEGGIAGFLDELVLNRGEARRLGFIGFESPVFLGYGEFVPDAGFCTLEPDPASVDWTARTENQRPFWALLRDMRDIPIPAGNPFRPVREALLRAAGRDIDNYAVALLRAGFPDRAREVLRIGRGIDPGNIAILLNLASLDSGSPAGDGFDPEAEVDRLLPSVHGLRWDCAGRFGCILNARDWVRKGRVWAISGEAPAPPAGRRETGSRFGEGALHAKWIDIAFACYGLPLPDEAACRRALVRDDRDRQALLDLAFLAMRANDPDMARACLAEAASAGHSGADTAFHRAILRYLDGEKDEAFESIRVQTTRDTLSERLWLADLLMAEEAADAKETDRARDALAAFRPDTLGARLSLARHFMDLRLWDLAQRELDRAAGLSPSSVVLWEMMGEVAARTGNATLMQVSLRALQARDPQHYLKYQNEGLLAYRQGDLERAEQAFRDGLARQRDPFLLNNLAHVVNERHGDCGDALALVDEAIRRAPGELSFLATRAAVNLSLGNPASALRDLFVLKKAGRMNRSRWILCMEALVQLGKCGEARRVGLAIARTPALAPAELDRIATLLQSCQ
jgi:tetratricopeptide (TPR) repeat protein